MYLYGSERGILHDTSVSRQHLTSFLERYPTVTQGFRNQLANEGYPDNSIRDVHYNVFIPPELCLEKGTVGFQITVDEARDYLREYPDSNSSLD